MAEIDLLKNLILWIWDNHRNHREGYLSDPRAAWIYSQLMAYKIMPISTREHLESYLPTQNKVANDFPRSLYLFLNPVTNGRFMLPVVSMKFNFGRSIPEFRCRLGLFLQNNEQLVAIGYRFESPEDAVGIHYYHHVQIIQGFEKENPFPPPEFNEWLPDSQPAFPIDSKNSVQTLLCLLVSLYGKDYPSQIARNPYFTNQLKPYWHEMHINSNTREMRWFWKMQNTRDGKSVKYFDSAKHPKELEETRKNYPGCDCHFVTETEFNQQSKDMRVKID